jgi:Putative peptidoglycan binding domain/LysM domain
MSYIVRAGDFLSKIATDHGIANWRTIYDHPNNADFRRRRPNPNLIYPGDQLFIPERPSTAKEVAAPAGGTAKFRAHRELNSLEMTLVDFEGLPLANKPFTLEIEGTPRPLTSDGSGHFRVDIPPGLTHAVLTIDGAELRLRIGQLNPMTDVDPDDVSGVQGRLANLGYYSGRMDGVLGDETVDAIRAFQRNHDLPETGEVSPLLENKLREKYGS